MSTPPLLSAGKPARSPFLRNQQPSNPIAVLFAGTGIKAEGIPEKGKTTELKIKVTVDKTASPGMREFRLACASGASTVGQILIADLPVVLEKLHFMLISQLPSPLILAVLCRA